MAFSDSAFEQRRAQILGETPVPTSGGSSSIGVIDQSFEKRRNLVLSAPVAKKQISEVSKPTQVSSSPIQTAKTSLGDISTNISNGIKTIANNIRLSLTAPSIAPKLPDSAFNRNPVTIQKPAKISPNQTKIDLSL